MEPLAIFSGVALVGLAGYAIATTSTVGAVAGAEIYNNDEDSLAASHFLSDASFAGGYDII